MRLTFAAKVSALAMLGFATWYATSALVVGQTARETVTVTKETARYGPGENVPPREPRDPNAVASVAVQRYSHKVNGTKISVAGAVHIFDRRPGHRYAMLVQVFDLKDQEYANPLAEKHYPNILLVPGAGDWANKYNFTDPLFDAHLPPGRYMLTLSSHVLEPGQTPAILKDLKLRLSSMSGRASGIITLTQD